MVDSAAAIFRYFPDLNKTQRNQFTELKAIYSFWNEQINVISRKDFDHFYVRHVLHSLAIAQVQSFLPDASILDIGTGGGFPGVPLAILFPDTQFHLVDSIGKKIKVVNEVALALNLKNVSSAHQRAEEVNEKYDFIVSRAVTAMPDFIPWTKGKFKTKSNHELHNGILYLKGGDLREEMKSIRQKKKYFDIPTYFDDAFFETKKVVYVEM